MELRGSLKRAIFFRFFFLSNDMWRVGFETDQPSWMQFLTDSVQAKSIQFLPNQLLNPWTKPVQGPIYWWNQLVQSGSNNHAMSSQGSSSARLLVDWMRPQFLFSSHGYNNPILAKVFWSDEQLKVVSKFWLQTNMKIINQHHLCQPPWGKNTGQGIFPHIYTLYTVWLCSG